MRLRKHLLGILAMVVAVLTLAPMAAQAVDVDLFVRLHGSPAYPTASGWSEYEHDATGREVEATLTNVKSLAGQRVTVIVNFKKVGTMLVSSTGRAHREWDTEHGDFVPLATVGSPVRIRTSAGTLIVSGKYVREVGD
jgi:hypothetical protein